jgi:hypothetical protein
MGWSLYCSQSQLQYHADELSHGFGFGICRHVVPVLTAASSFASGGLELRAVLQRLQRRHVHPSNRHFQSWRSLIDIRSCNQQRDVRCSVSYRCYLHRSIYYVRAGRFREISFGRLSLWLDDWLWHTLYTDSSNGFVNSQSVDSDENRKRKKVYAS